MRRRRFIELLAASAVGGTAAARTGHGTLTTSVTALRFHSTCSLYGADGGPLTDSTVVPVWAEDEATNDDQDYDDDAFVYWDWRQIPLVASEDGVVAFGSVLVDDANLDGSYDNEQFVLNVWDQELGGSGTVIWDESNAQYYDLSKFSSFESAAESAGYDVQPTTNLHNDLSGADAAVITSPGDALSDGELDKLAQFVDDGGVLFLHDQSDYNNYDETNHLNDITFRLGLSFQFNDDQVADTQNNAGASYRPTTTVFNTDFGYFDGGSGGGGGGDDGGDDGGSGSPDTTTVTIESLSDGDTFDVTMPDGSVESIRVLGVDTPEKASNRSAERPPEWEGIESYDYLATWGANATDFSKQAFDVGDTVEIFYDDNEGQTDPFGRLLAYVRYDATGDGSRDTLYNRELIEQGYARVYGSALTKHDGFRNAEATARANGTGLWANSDPNASSEIRDGSYSELFFPKAAAVETSTGALADSRAPVYDQSGATPLVGVDSSANVAMVGGLTIDESYESEEGYPVDTAEYGNYPFLTSLVDSLTSTTGSIVIDGGHGQFGSDAALSNEDAAYYQRYLEGQDIAFEQRNDLATADLSGARAVVVTTPSSTFTSAEKTALSDFVAGGGAVVLMGASNGDATDLNDLASALGTDLRLGGSVRDSSNNLDGDETVPTTSSFDSSFGLFGPYS
ncbi:DUF4350 domain-containing protein [Haloarchaeobius sp. HME9146]|uniref:DUF4350 domain-containing protein n=1 Tax=Haloarchaeobius sp. HME9146 TaxID=2978732 RepID=UPI0021C1E8CC|nr:DUF4350 domain-containing protein [Haloarchaeobius sp. HME9146]MCT9094528.1 thermonuclease family protein [Haloarchaeobius sp. HME9146]